MSYGNVDDFYKLYILLGWSEFLFPNKMENVFSGCFPVVEARVDAEGEGQGEHGNMYKCLKLESRHRLKSKALRLLSTTYFRKRRKTSNSIKFLFPNKMENIFSGLLSSC